MKYSQIEGIAHTSRLGKCVCKKPIYDFKVIKVYEWGCDYFRADKEGTLLEARFLLFKEKSPIDKAILIGLSDFEKHFEILDDSNN